MEKGRITQEAGVRALPIATSPFYMAVTATLLRVGSLALESVGVGSQIGVG